MVDGMDYIRTVDDETIACALAGWADEIAEGDPVRGLLLWEAARRLGRLSMADATGREGPT